MFTFIFVAGLNACHLFVFILLFKHTFKKQKIVGTILLYMGKKLKESSPPMDSTVLNVVYLQGEKCNYNLTCIFFKLICR